VLKRKTSLARILCIFPAVQVPHVRGNGGCLVTAGGGWEFHATSEGFGHGLQSAGKASSFLALALSYRPTLCFAKEWGTHGVLGMNVEAKDEPTPAFRQFLINRLSLVFQPCQF